MEEVIRRSANYEAGVWDNDYIQSLASPYTGEKYVREAEKLKGLVRILIHQTEQELDQLHLIDNVTRLGVSGHFKDQIAKMLDKMYEAQEWLEEDLHFTSLKFRLLRQHGYHVPQEVFCSLMDEEGNFKVSLCEDVRGLVSLYEASYLSMEGENIMDLAKDFSLNHLAQTLEQITEPRLKEQVRHALEVPLHWRLHKLEARWFIQAYENTSEANLTLVELAKLDYNMVQATYQQELKLLSSWYKETGLPEKLGFVRYRLAECFLWAMGFIPEPHLGYSREIMSKVAVMITIIDDIYDVYGTLEELQLFTHTIERWDINSLDSLPEYMKICFLALFNSVNELAYHILREQGFNVISNMRNLWAELWRAYYLEAAWFNSGYVPTTDEYLNTAWISISGPLLLFYGYFTTNPINKKELKSLEQYPGIIRRPATVLRLADDLATSSDEMKRGDVPKSIQCYMKETGCSEEDARKHIKQLIDTTLTRMNKEILMENPIKNFGQTAMNLGRISLCMYQHGDHYGHPHSETKKNLVSLVVQPIPMP
ncbi:exo-alpha-bergamotene synthase-like [Salvia hispanica]|uniref:exo-alpha-bergamotene synthase-like n=1 Tax=Salvia hispanica TaxID=49212 RepID=UPI0020099421|nr:exo-alpha-bergamotene synthase-like [Salvia hispanica]XP_047978995.1 exo-alpha-bergamotene synthase-like [Salvia hispanica]